MSFVWVNGWLQPADRAGLSALDRGFTLGDGLFETVRVYQGTPFRLDAHLERLEEGLGRLGMLPPDEEGLPRVREGVEEVLRESDHPSGSLRISVSRGRGAPGLAPPRKPDPSVVVALAGYEPDPSWYSEGIRAVVTGGRVASQSLTSSLKHLGYLEFVLARQEALRRGGDDGLLLTEDGTLAEGTASNLFVVRRNALLTPPLDQGILPGVTRATVLEVAGRHGVPVKEAPLPLEVLGEAQEAFLTSSLRELVPVVEVDGEPVGEGRPGPMWQRLRELYRERVGMETGAALEED